MNTPELAPSTMLDESDPSLVELAVGMTRAQVMKYVVCEPLSRGLYDVFKPLEDYELKKFPAITPDELTGGRLEEWIDMLVQVAELRSDPCPPALLGIRELAKARSIFYWESIGTAIQDGIRSGIAVPAIVAAHIYRLETTERDRSTERLRSAEALESDKIDVDKFIAIMKRDSFARILHHLTKGPNGFLGNSSTSTDYTWANSFFQFNNPKSPLRERKLSEGVTLPPARDPLLYCQAYELQDGKVVGLSPLYHLAAQLQRESLRAERERDLHAIKTRRLKKLAERTYDPTDSSGCPVRHAYRDESGETRPPLILTARDFIIQALRDSLRYSETTSAGARNS